MRPRLIRIRVDQPLFMARSSKDSQAILRTLERTDQRSPLFWWMADHFDEIAARARRGRISWTSFCAEVAKQGLTDRNGQPPTDATARKTWARVRAAVRQVRANEEAKPAPRPGSVYPSRIPKDWKPSGFRDAPHGAAKPPGGGGSTPPTGSQLRLGTNASVAATAVQGTFVDPEDPPEVQQMYLDIEAQLRRADRYLGPPIKKRSE